MMLKRDFSKYTDDKLFELIKDGNNRALKSLFERYFLRLCEFSMFYVSNTALAEEVVSDVFVNIWVNRKKIVIKTNLKAYLYTSVRNRSINYFIREQRKNETFFELPKESNIISENSPHVELSLMELENAIESLIQQLPPKRQLIFRLNRIYGLKYKEIAELLSISVNTVQNHMVKAIEFMMKHYPKIKSFHFLLLFLLLQ